MKKIVLSILTTIYFCNFLAAADENLPPSTQNEMHILERLSVSFPENEQSNWNNLHASEKEGRVFEVWEKESDGISFERLILITMPWDEEGPQDVVDAIDALAHAFKDHAEVMRRTKSDDEIAIALHLNHSWDIIRVITTPYALHIATYVIKGGFNSIDPELYLDKLDQYVEIVY